MTNRRVGRPRKIGLPEFLWALWLFREHQKLERMGLRGISEALGVCEETAGRYIREAVALGFLAQRRPVYRPAIYWFRFKNLPAPLRARILLSQSAIKRPASLLPDTATAVARNLSPSAIAGWSGKAQTLLRAIVGGGYRISKLVKTLGLAVLSRILAAWSSCMRRRWWRRSIRDPRKLLLRWLWRAFRQLRRAREELGVAIAAPPSALAAPVPYRADVSPVAIAALDAMRDAFCSQEVPAGKRLPGLALPPRATDNRPFPFRLTKEAD